MNDLHTLLHDAAVAGYWDSVMRNPASQFGPKGRRYLGATILPERMVDDVAYREEYIRFRAVIANAGTRYGPVQLKGADLLGSFMVELGHSDIGREFTSRDYDTLRRYLDTKQSMEALTMLLRWVDTSAVVPLLEHNEKNRWEAIVDSKVTLTGDNAYTEDVAYYNPAGHRAAAAGDWSIDTNDPMVDIFAMINLLSSKGFTANRIVTSRKVMTIMAKNALMKQYAGSATLDAAGNLVVRGNYVTLTGLNGVMNAMGLPPIEIYDLQYRTQDSTGYFLKQDVFVILCTTGQDETIDMGDSEYVLNDTFGYTAVGPAAGQNAPGRVLLVEAFDNKPPRVQAEGWQASLPVITEPEAIAVITGIK